jgi:hypothetical protein
MPRIEIEQETHEIVKKSAEAKGVSMVSYVNQTIKDVGIANKDAKVIITIPSNLLKNNKDKLAGWLKQKMQAIVQAYYPGA